ncbi:hypothetical protein ACHAXS_004832 [Conticribra weissflogii]
MDLRKVLQKVS